MWNFGMKMKNSRIKIAPSLCKSINFRLEKKNAHLKNIHQNLLPLVTHSVQCCKTIPKMVSAQEFQIIAKSIIYYY